MQQERGEGAGQGGSMLLYAFQIPEVLWVWSTGLEHPQVRAARSFPWPAGVAAERAPGCAGSCRGRQRGTVPRARGASLQRSPHEGTTVGSETRAGMSRQSRGTFASCSVPTCPGCAPPSSLPCLAMADSGPLCAALPPSATLSWPEPQGHGH